MTARRFSSVPRRKTDFPGLTMSGDRLDVFFHMKRSDVFVKKKEICRTEVAFYQKRLYIMGRNNCQRHKLA